jgi:hypothetical protein
LQTSSRIENAVWLGFFACLPKSHVAGVVEDGFGEGIPKVIATRQVLALDQQPGA